MNNRTKHEIEICQNLDFQFHIGENIMCARFQWLEKSRSARTP